MRSKKAKKRITTPDPLYKSRVVARFINIVMLDGEKSTAEKVVYGALEKLAEDRKEGLAMFEEAVKVVMPKQEVRSRRIGGATYQVPMPVKHTRAEALALRWIVRSARTKHGKPMEEKLYVEIKNAYEGIGDSVKKRDDTHKMAEANRAFAHFRF
ncbi:30S ribosomal protein S7 [Candidatus Nomurabacteria bacterium]|uniref:Small ribosomal subunit protein uS7 n=1 Tax=candidate division WWE3 bacterium TaxID=2053526 RepID=A0A955DZJ6_UNCKA|nr:30S ribosomal protein S7 [candidate division WWE3 bacterium]MCB9823788.1 30S ribosomal protein S7 [Candidatus Nomurabacteria bacterium]MCB9826806.1 30S ribosomal protein S7 [Candidatus Nomurabacteria bacterium]MCB9827583.1 30S ribosomal protein S7 [Candidatus Nomurabacteria bacterium]